MSIRIEVTGNSLEEVADKLRALAGQFQFEHEYKHVSYGPNGPIEEVQKPKAKKAAKKAEAEVAEPAPADPTPETSAPTSDTSTTSDEEPATPPASASEPLDFENDVAPVVIDAVGKIGKEAVSEVLSQFGATRASEVDPAQWGELVDALKAKL